MTWFAFQNDGHVYDLNGLAEKELVATGAKGYSTEAEALAHRNAPANPTTQLPLLTAFVTAASFPFGGGIQGVIQVVNTDSTGQNKSKVGPLNNPLTDLLPKGWSLIFGNTHGLLTRILKVVFGGVLLLAGILKLSSTDKRLADVLPLLGGPAGKLLQA